MSNIYLEVGNKVRFYRKLQKFTQEELSEINITLETLAKISDALQVNPSMLLEYNQKEEILNKINFLIYSLNLEELNPINRILKEIIILNNLEDSIRIFNMIFFITLIYTGKR